MEAQCWNSSCEHHLEVFFHNTHCPHCSYQLTPITSSCKALQPGDTGPYCSIQLTPATSSCPALQPVDTGAAFSSLFPSSFEIPTPVHNEQMDHLSIISDYYRSGVYPEPRLSDRNSFLDSQAPSTTSSNEGLGSRKEQQNVPNVLAWVNYSHPIPEKGVKEVCFPACISCYNSSPCYRGPSTDCCVACSGKNKYCQGIVQLPELIKNRSWYKDTLAYLKSMCPSVDAIGGCQSVFSLEIYVHSASKKERCEVSLAGLNDNLPIPDDLSSLERILDLVFPANKKVSLDNTNQSSQPGQDDIALELLETFTRRFSACLTLLRTPTLCTFDERLWKDPAAPYVMLEFLRQLSREACDLLQHIASEINRFANSKHQKKTFTRAKASVAFNIGIIHTSIQSFALGGDDWAELHFMLETLYDVTPEVLRQLRWLGRGFNQRRFEQGVKSLQTEHAGIHIAFPLPQDDRKLAGVSSNQRYSFVNVIGSVIPPDIGPMASKPPVRVVQSNASALQPQNQNSIVADLLHAEPDLEMYEATQAEQSALDCDTKGEDTKSTISPLEGALTATCREDSEAEAVPLPSGLKPEQHIRQLELQYKQRDTIIRQLQIQQATLKMTIETYKYGLAHEPRHTRSKPKFSEMDITPEATVLANDDGAEYEAESSASVSCSGKTTPVEDNDGLDREDRSSDKLCSYDRMDITSQDTEPRTSTFIREVASQSMGAHQPQLSKRPNPHGNDNRPSKRKRISLLSSKRLHDTTIVRQTTEKLETQSEHTEKAGRPITNHGLSKNRLSQLLRFKQQTQRVPEEDLVVINSSRPQSYPLSSLWRRSAVVSVKTITDAFESLALA